jgi:hemerythrin-like domain-containing protein
MIDHKLILRSLQVLHAIDEDIRQGRAMDPNIIQSLLTFLREFADGSHHVKEQAILFPALMHAGLRPDEGPIQVMNDEHERGRALTIAMQAALNRNRVDDFLTYSTRYVELLSRHTEKEERILFAKAELILSEEEDEQVAADFDHFEKLTACGETHELLHRTIDMLASKYHSDLVTHHASDATRMLSSRAHVNSARGHESLVR